MSKFSDGAKNWWASPAGMKEREKRRAKRRAAPDADATGPTQWRPSAPIPTPEPEPEFEAPPETSPPPTAPSSDEFVKPSDVKDRKLGRDLPQVGSKGGWVADMIAAVGQKIHETEELVTGDPKLHHGSADERIWQGLGHYVEEMIDIEKYGIIILLIVLVSAEMTRVGILVVDLQKKGVIGKPNPRRKPEGADEEAPEGPRPQVK